MDAKAEASKRWPMGTGQGAYEAFLAGAAWALREFGDLLDVAGAKKEFCTIAGVALMSYASEAHHIADGIEGQ